MLPKPGKDIITIVLNEDVKIYAKILANSLKSLVPSLIHHEQVGFVLDRGTKDNTKRTISLIHYAKKHSVPFCLLSVDAEKAFDRVN